MRMDGGHTLLREEALVELLHMFHNEVTRRGVHKHLREGVVAVVGKDKRAVLNSSSASRSVSTTTSGERGEVTPKIDTSNSAGYETTVVGCGWTTAFRTLRRLPSAPKKAIPT